MIPFLHRISVLLLSPISHHLGARIQPDNHTLLPNAAVDIPRSKAELVVENAFLRQQLMVLGQDPDARRGIKVVLNLDRRGNLRRCLERLCGMLGLDLSASVCASNYVKNFFIKPPTQIEDIDLLREAGSWWLPHLHKELSCFPAAPIITLGQPLRRALVRRGASEWMRDYWGYTLRWRCNVKAPFDFLRVMDNLLGRPIFPFPHQPRMRKRFYRDRLSDYASCVRRKIVRWESRPLGRDA